MACKLGVLLLVATVAFFQDATVSANMVEVANLVNEGGDAELPLTNRQVDDPLREYISHVGGVTGLQLPSGIRDIERVRENILAGKWESFTPRPVLEPDCHVEVVQRLPGRCIHLGRLRTPACQSQTSLSLNAPECT